MSGRKRLSEEERKISVRLTIKKKYLMELRKRNVNISYLFENFVKNYLNID